MEFSPEDLQKMWASLILYVNVYVSNPRKDKLIALYEKYQGRIMLSPASGKEHYHNAFPGGYLEHTINVVENALLLHEMYVNRKIKTADFSKEEVVFCALNHDLGKIGDGSGEYYLPIIDPREDWKRRRGEIYKLNGSLHYMDVTNRTFFLLNQAGITMSQVEWLGILLTDGLYEERKNESYYVSYSPEFQLKTNLPYLLHQADMMALMMERDRWRMENEKSLPHLSAVTPTTVPKKTKSEPQKRNADLKNAFEKSKHAADIFNTLFGDSKEK
jgi:hypothetical protein